MCGIAGFIDNKLDYDYENVLKNMVISLNHRGPDSQNYWKSYDQKILIGHSRLSKNPPAKTLSTPVGHSGL